MIKSLVLLLVATSCLAACDPNANKEKLQGVRIDVIGPDEDEKLIKSATVKNLCEVVGQNDNLISMKEKVDVAQSAGIANQTLVFDNKVLYLKSFGEVSAYDTDLKKELWSYKIPNPNNIVFVGGMSHDQHTLYIAYGSGSILAINLRDGKLKWTSALEDIVRGAPLVHHGKLYLQTVGNHLYALNVKDGSIIWRHIENNQDIKLSHITSPVVVENAIYMQVAGREIISLNSDTGEIVNSIQLSDQYGFRSIMNKRSFLDFLYADGKIIYSVANSGELTAIDAIDNTIRWKSKLILQSKFMVYDDSIYFITEQNQLAALDKRSSKIKWLSNLSNCMNKANSGLWAAPIVYKDQIIVTHYTGLMVAFDKISGRAVWKKDDMNLITNAPVVYRDDSMYSASNDGHIYLYRYKKSK